MTHRSYKINNLQTFCRDKEEDLLYVQKRCEKCGDDSKIRIPKEVINIMKKCGARDERICENFYEYELNNWFYSWNNIKCDLCGKKRVLAWFDGNSPSGVHVVMPSMEIDFWMGYDYPIHKIRVCKFCEPDHKDKRSRNNYIKKIFRAMQREEDKNWNWKKKHEK